MKKIFIFTILSMTIVLFSCGNKSSNKSQGGIETLTTDCYDEYDKMYNMNQQIGNSLSEVNNLVLGWHFNDEYKTKAIGLLKNAKTACDESLAFKPTCDKLNESKTILDETATKLNPLIAITLESLENEPNEDIYFGKLSQLRKDFMKVQEEIGYHKFDETINASGANVVL